MPLHTHAELERIDRCIVEAQLGRLTDSETIVMIIQRCGLTISKRMLIRHKISLRRRTEKMWDIYRKDNFAYKLLHAQLMDEADDSLRIINGEILEYKKDSHKNFFRLHKCLADRLEWVKWRETLITKIPDVDSAVRTESHALEYSQQQEEPSTGENGASGRIFG